MKHQEEVRESTLRPGGWMPHANPSKLRERRYEFASVKPFGLFVVLNRDEGLDETHGPERLAMLFVGGDGHATFDALYCQNDGTRAPFLVVVEDYGCGGNYDQFGEGRDSRVYRAALRCPARLATGRKSLHRMVGLSRFRRHNPISAGCIGTRAGSFFVRTPVSGND